MKLANFLQRRLSIVAILCLSGFLGLTWLVGDGVVRYTSLYNQSQVLGSKTVEQPQCIPSTTFDQFLTTNKATVTLFAPDTSVSFPLSSLKQCFTATGCDQAGFTCNEGTIKLVSSCVAEYFRKFPLGVEHFRVITGAGASAQVRSQDWSVNYENLAEQLDGVVSKGLSYCQVEKAEKLERQNLGTIQLAVADETPGIAVGSFADRFIEVDASKQRLYYWNKGVYQAFVLVHGARTPKEGIYLRKVVNLAQFVGSIDVAYLEKNSELTDYVVIHQ